MSRVQEMLSDLGHWYWEEFGWPGVAFLALLALWDVFAYVVLM